MTKPQENNLHNVSLERLKTASSTSTQHVTSVSMECTHLTTIMPKNTHAQSMKNGVQSKNGEVAQCVLRMATTSSTAGTRIPMNRRTHA